ncbi:hypothetical protein HDU82_004073, partial [Entophlyctis luteolus]
MPHSLSATALVLTDFCTSKILQWVEVMAVEKQLGQLQEGCIHLVKLLDSLSSPKNTDVPLADDHRTQSDVSSLGLARDLLYDVSRLAARFHPALDFNPLHIYQSALTFTPHDTKLYQQFQSLAGGKITVSPDLTWGPLVSLMSGHTAAVTSVAYNHDGSLIASGSEDNTVRVWNALSGALVSELKGHSEKVTSVAFNHDGSLIASASYDETGRVWNPLSGALVSELEGHFLPVISVAFNHDGSLIASGSEDNT